MKSSPASLLAVVSLSLALCACDSGDKKDTGKPQSLPPKPTKETAPAAPDAAGNPPPPISDEAAQKMNEPPAPAPALDPGVINEKVSRLEIINTAVKTFKSKQAGQSGMMSSGKSIEELRKMAKPGAATPLTSLDQLVKGGFLKSIPAAPAGKKYVIDATTGEVRLENK